MPGRGHALFTAPTGTRIPGHVQVEGEVVLTRRGGAFYLMVEPSVHPESGDVYHWERRLPKDPSLVPVIPTEFLHRARSRATSGSEGSRHGSDDWVGIRDANDGSVPESYRHDYLVHRARKLFLANDGLRDVDALADVLAEVRDQECADGDHEMADDEVTGIAEWVVEGIEPIDPAVSATVIAAVESDQRLAARWYGDVSSMRSLSARSIDWVLARQLHRAGVPVSEVLPALVWRWKEGLGQEPPDPAYFRSLVSELR